MDNKRYFIVLYQGRLIGYTAVEVYIPIYPNSVSGKIDTVNEEYSKLFMKEVTKSQYIYLSLTNIPEMTPQKVNYVDGGHCSVPVVIFARDDIIGMEVHIDSLTEECWNALDDMLGNRRMWY